MAGGIREGNGDAERSALVCQATIEICHELGVSPDEALSRYTRSQWRIITETLERRRLRDLHDRAVIAYTATNHAITSAFGSKGSSFDSFLRQFEYRDERSGPEFSAERMAEMKIGAAQSDSDMSSWEEL
jgi:hypothetical protein